MKEAEIKHLVNEGWIHVRMIFEIAGTPEEFVNKTLKEVTEKFEKEKIKIISHVRHPAKDVGEKVFSGFAEAKFLASKMSDLFGIIYDYMPSSVEIIEPDELKETTANISDIVNDLTAKLHQYNNAFNQLHARNVLLQNKLASAGDSKPKAKKK